MLSIGIVDLPNVGKSTLFQALTRISLPIAPYPFTTIEPHVGGVTVPDERGRDPSNCPQEVPELPSFRGSLANEPTPPLHFVKNYQEMIKNTGPTEHPRT